MLDLGCQTEGPDGMASHLGRRSRPKVRPAWFLWDDSAECGTANGFDNDERQRQARRDGGAEYGGRRQGTPENAQTRDVQSFDAERRLHPDGVRGPRPGTVLSKEPRRGHTNYVTRAPAGGRGV